MTYDETQLVFVREDADSTLWWPAVMGSSHRTIVSTFSSEEEKARFTAIYFKQGWHDTKEAIARIFHYKKYPNNKKMFLLIAANEQSDLVCDFFVNCEEVGKISNHIEGWNEAFYEALQFKLGPDDECCSSEPEFGSPGGGLYAPETNGNGHLQHGVTAAVDQHVTGGKRKLLVQPSTESATMPSSRKKSRCESKDEDKEMDSSSSSSVKRDESTKIFQTPTSKSYGMQEQQDSPIPLEQQCDEVAQPQSNFTLPEHSYNLIVSSGAAPRKKKSAKQSNAHGSHNGLRMSIQKYDDWATVWEILCETYGWVVRKGDGLAELYYIPGELSHRSLDYLKKNSRLGKDYYGSEEDVKRYVREKFLWEGPAMKKSSTQSKDEASSTVDTFKSKDLTQDPMLEPDGNEVCQAVPLTKTVKRKGKTKEFVADETDHVPRKEYTIEPDNLWPTVLSKIQYNLQLQYKGNLMMVKSKYHHLTEKEIRTQLTEYEDYFESEDHLKEYAFHTYGWRGLPGKEYVPNDALYGGRRRRDKGGDDKKQSPTSSISLTKHTNTVSTKANSAKRGSSTKKKSKTSVSKDETSHRISSVSTNHKTKKNSSTNRKKPSKVSTETNQVLEVEELKHDKNLESTEDIELKEKDEVTNKSLSDRISDCIRYFHPALVYRDMFFAGLDSDSKVSRNRDKLMSFLRGCLDLEEKHFRGESSLLYMCGGPGTGKTSMVKYCIEVLETDDLNTDFKHAFVKATDIVTSPSDLIHTISVIIGKKTTIKKIEQVEKRLTSGFKNGPIFLFIDELDFLLQKVPSNDSVVANVLRWACDPNNRLVVVGISNSVGGNGAKVLHENFKVFEEILFEPFSAEDLTEIVNKRLGGNNLSLVDKNAVVYAAKRTANNRGDAREILHVMSEAFSLASQSLTSEQLSTVGPVESPIVKMPHVLKSIKNNGEYSKATIIESLPGNARIILCVASALGQIGSRWKIVKLSELKSYCANATSVCEDFSLSVFDSSIELLMDSGLMCYDYSYDMSDGDHDDRGIKLGVHLHDVEIALEDTLLKEGSFYSNLVNYVKSNDICDDDDEE